jgi:hypothetical protein
LPSLALASTLLGTAMFSASALLAAVVDVASSRSSLGGPRPGLIPIVAFVDQLRPHDGNQVIVLVPLAPEGHRRSQILHSHLELVLTAALRAAPTSSPPGS